MSEYTRALPGHPHSPRSNALSIGAPCNSGPKACCRPAKARQIRGRCRKCSLTSRALESVIARARTHVSARTRSCPNSSESRILLHLSLVVTQRVAPEVPKPRAHVRAPVPNCHRSPSQPAPATPHANAAHAASSGRRAGARTSHSEAAHSKVRWQRGSGCCTSISAAQAQKATAARRGPSGRSVGRRFAARNAQRGGRSPRTAGSGRQPTALQGEAAHNYAEHRRAMRRRFRDGAVPAPGPDAIRHAGTVGSGL